MNPLLHLRGIAKRFGEIVANDGVGFALAAGEIHALLGENGAGKTTLMNIAYGLTQPDDGIIEVEGRRIRPRSPAEAIAAGIGMVHQHPLLVGPLTVAENMRLGGVGDGTAAGLRRDVERAGLVLPQGVHPDQRVAVLPLSQRQQLEIVRCLVRNVHVLILDEPTAVLTPEEVQALFEHLRGLAGRGRGVVFISHKLTEVLDIAGRVTVLRGGRNAGTFAAGDTSAAELASHMIGHRPEPNAGRANGERDPEPDAPSSHAPRGRVRLSLEHCCLDDRFGRRELDGVNLTVAAGEIVGVAGVEGNGQRPLAQVLFGLRTCTSGSVRLDGLPLPAVSRWPDAGVRLGRVPADRRESGLIPDAPLWRNLLLGPMAPSPDLFLRKPGTLRWARSVLDEYGVNPPDPLLPAATLSGGNQQKLVLARELSGRPEVLVAVNPTQGLDALAQTDLHRRLDTLRGQGVAVLVISTELDEVMRLADRVGVLSGGRLWGPYAASAVTRNAIGMLMAGVDEQGVFGAISRLDEPRA